MKFTRSDWAFHELPPDEIKAAWLWELEREAFNQQTRAWRELSGPHRGAICSQVNVRPDFPIKEFDLETYANPHYVQTHGAAHFNSPCALHLLQIDWSKGKTSLLRAFGDWIETKPSEKQKRTWNEWTDKGGRRGAYKAWLTDLAMHRATRSGLSPEKAAIRLYPLGKWAGIVATAANKFSPPHWPAAVKRSERRIDERKRSPAILTNSDLQKTLPGVWCK